MAYIADASRLEPGSIVRVEKPLSSSGKPTYPHYFIVLDMPDPLKPGDCLPLVGVSSRIDPRSADPSRHVPMKWLARKKGDPESGFSAPCRACVDFTHLLEVYRGRQFQLEVAAEHHGRFIRADKLHILVATVNAWIRKKT